jgi:hypothetical protein
MPKPDPIPELKRQAAHEICRAIEKLTLLEAAIWIELDRWRIADIRAGRLERFSLETLIRLLSRVHAQVALDVRHSKRVVPS